MMHKEIWVKSIDSVSLLMFTSISEVYMILFESLWLVWLCYLRRDGIYFEKSLFQDQIVLLIY